MSDMADVWRHAPDADEIRKSALSANISDFDSEKLNYLVRRFGELFASPQSNLTFRVTDPDMEIRLEISENLTWTFLLTKCLDLQKSRFFRDFCLLSIKAYSFLQHKAAKLEDVIHIQQKYALYLEENYKTVNGTELMDKYKRQHPEDAKLLLDFDKEQFDSVCRNEYKSLPLSSNNTWSRIKSTLQDNSWMQDDISLMQDDMDIKVKKEKYASLDGVSAPMPIGAINLKRPKLEESEDEPRKKVKREDSMHLPSSPTKPRSSSPIRLDGSSPRRRRIGRIGRK